MDRGKAAKKHEVAGAKTGVPDRPFYKIGDVCELTDTQPYVLRFWETEFPQLAPKKSRAGQRIYQKKDVDLVLRIKKLLYEEEYTIAGARRKLEEEAAGQPGARAAVATEEAKAHARKKPDHPSKKSAAQERNLLNTLRALRHELRNLKKILEP